MNEVPAADRPPVNVTHLTFHLMVGVGFALLGLAGWLALARRRHRDLSRSPSFLRAAALSGVGAVLALEAGSAVRHSPSARRAPSCGSNGCSVPPSHSPPW